MAVKKSRSQLVCQFSISFTFRISLKLPAWFHVPEKPAIFQILLSWQSDNHNGKRVASNGLHCRSLGYLLLVRPQRQAPLSGILLFAVRCFTFQFSFSLFHHQQSNLFPMFFHCQLRMLVQNGRNLL